MFMGWKGAFAWLVVSGQMPARNVAQQRAEGRGRRRQRQRPPQPLGGGKATGQQADGRAFHITLAAGNLAGKAQTGTPFQLESDPSRSCGELM